MKSLRKQASSQQQTWETFGTTHTRSEYPGSCKETLAPTPTSLGMKTRSMEFPILAGGADKSIS
jgi:hypothetical protein